MNKPVSLQDLKQLAEGRLSDAAECARIFAALADNPALQLTFDAFLAAGEGELGDLDTDPGPASQPVVDADQAGFAQFVKNLGRSRLLPVIGGGQPVWRMLRGESSAAWEGCFQAPASRDAVEFKAVGEAAGRVRIKLTSNAALLEPLGLVALKPAFAGLATAGPSLTTHLVTPAAEQRWARARGRDSQLAAQASPPRPTLAAQEIPRARQGVYQVNERQPGEYVISTPARGLPVDWVVVEFHGGTELLHAENLFLTNADPLAAEAGLREGVVGRPESCEGVTHVTVRAAVRDDLPRLAPGELSTLLAEREFVALPVTRQSAEEFTVQASAEVQTWLAEPETLVIGLRAVLTQEIK
jgi:hypothetical protein